MSANTKIEWCDHSWSPWRGCTKVSPGCANCYAERLSWRNPKVLGEWGRGRPRVLARNWAEPVKWNKANRYGFVVTDPPVTVFPSLCDWLDDEVPVEWLAKFLALIRDTPNLTWLLLTKRPQLWQDRIELVHRAADFNGGGLTKWTDDWMTGTPPPNVWVGTSVEDQKRADERIPALLQIPAVGRFLSVEPLLGPVEFNRHTMFGTACMLDEPVQRNVGRGMTGNVKKGIHWVIIGGESGPGARPCNVDWIRSLVRQCRDASVAPFVKQVGAVPCGYSVADSIYQMRKIRITHPKGGDPAEWPEDLRVREFPEGLR